MIFLKKRHFCVLCRKYKNEGNMHIVYKNIGVCKKCYSEIETTKDKTFEARGPVSILLAPYINAGKIKEAVKHFKFLGQRMYGHLFGDMIYEEFSQYDWLTGYDFIVPVPLHEKRLLERGYNQSEIIADSLASNLDLPVYKDVLFRIRNTKKQSKLKGLARKENVEGAFFAYGEELKGKRVILIDDIYTAGETAMACAEALKSAGAEEVAVITFLKTKYKK